MSFRLTITVCLIVLIGTPVHLWANFQDPNQLLKKAVTLHQSGDFQGAVVIYQQLIQTYPGFADLHSNIGAAYVSLGDHGKAIEHYEKALSLGNGSDPSAIRFNLALAYYKSARFDEAGNQLKRVLVDQPQHEKAALLLGDIYCRRGDWKEVVSLLKPFETRLGDDQAYIYQMGTALIRDGQTYEGELWIDKILRHGDTAEAHFLLGTAYVMVMDYDGALKEFEKAMKLNPNLPTLNAVYARTLREIGRVDDSIEYFQRELELDPNNYDSLLYIGVYKYKREQKYEEALDYFDRALKIRPGSLDARFQIGLVYVVTNQVHEALKIVEEVVEEAPEFLEGHVTLTRLYYRLKRKEEARKHQKIVVELRAKQDAEKVKTQQEAEALQRRLADKKPKP